MSTHLKQITVVSSVAKQKWMPAAVGLAMWQPMAEALGRPDHPISLKRIVDLANDPKGWRASATRNGAACGLAIPFRSIPRPCAFT